MAAGGTPPGSSRAARQRTAGGLTSAGIVLVLIVLSSSTSLLITAALGCLVAVMVGVRPWSRPSPGRRAEPRRAGKSGAPPGTRGTSADALRPGTRTPTPAIAPRGLHVRWWRRDGHDRLYVTDAAGVSLGWLDRATGTLRVLDERHRGDVEHALRTPRTPWRSPPP